MRYVKERRAAGATDEQATHWIASIQYGYVRAGEGSATAQLESARIPRH